MQRIWNYFFYSTWKLHTKVVEILIENPLIYILNKFPFLQKKWEKGRKEYNKVVKNKNLGANILFAYYGMLMTTSVIYSIFFLYICHFFQIKVGDKMGYYFITVVVLSCLTNGFFSWRKDVYLKYFTEFDTINKKSLIYLPAVLFHLGVSAFAVLSIYWTVGFNFK